MLGNYKFKHDIHDSYQVKGSKYTNARISPMFQHVNITLKMAEIITAAKTKRNTEHMKTPEVLKFKVL